MTTVKTEAAFTPGPWEALKGVEQTDDMRCGVAAVRGDYRFLVATIENGAPGDFCDTELANARLIAAAPALYEAVRLFVNYDARDDHDGVTMILAYAEALEVARDALARARGDAPSSKGLMDG